jgi:hypothetical protein
MNAATYSSLRVLKTHKQSQRRGVSAQVELLSIEAKKEEKVKLSLCLNN